jgi:hypothetical protein
MLFFIVIISYSLKYICLRVIADVGSSCTVLKSVLLIAKHKFLIHLTIFKVHMMYFTNMYTYVNCYSVSQTNYYTKDKSDIPMKEC